MKVWVLIPAYNEAAYIAKTVREVKKKINNVLVVDDGSSDRTAELAEQAGARVVKHKVNQGKGQAKQTGFDWLLSQNNFAAVITADADGQHSPEDLAVFVRIWKKSKADLVLGSRMHNPQGMPLVRYLTNRIMSLTNSLLAGALFQDSQCDYRLIDRKVLDKVRITHKGFEADAGFLFQAARRGFNIVSAPVRTIYIEGRQSKIRPVRDTLRYAVLCFKQILNRIK